jgi:Spy/CpxP family protein refolding chaperone
MTQAAKCFAVAALLLGASFTAAMAQTAPDAGAPPKAEPPPVADKGTTAQYNCIAEGEHYAGQGRHAVYRIELTNKCEQRLRCRVYAYQVSAKGPSQGRTTLILGPKSSGAAASKIYELKVKAVGGLGTWTRECRAL